MNDNPYASPVADTKSDSKPESKTEQIAWIVAMRLGTSLALVFSAFSNAIRIGDLFWRGVWLGSFCTVAGLSLCLMCKEVYRVLKK